VEEVDRELLRIARYGPVQAETCATAGAGFEAPDYGKLVWLAPSVAAGNRRVYGHRYAETESWSGWSLMAQDEAKPAPDEIVFEHLLHLVTIREDLMPFLGFPVGWTFSIHADGSWSAWSPKEVLLTDIDAFLTGSDLTPDNAVSIAESIGDDFAGTPIAETAVEPLITWAADPQGVVDVRSHLTFVQAWLEANVER
jgi:hypothetical protein